YSHSVQLDSTDPAALRAVGITNFDAVVVSIGAGVQESILTTLLLKEMGCKKVVSKASGELQARVLEKVGADLVIRPERDMAVRVARSLASGHVVDLLELSPNLLVEEVSAGPRVNGKSLGDLVLRSRYGVSMLEEVLDAGVPVAVLVYDPHALAGPRGEALLDRARRHGARLVTAAPHVVAACSQVDTPQGVVAVVARSPAVLSDLLNVAGLVVIVADRLQDPGNLGTIIRTADAAGATAVLATHGTVDPSNPKVVRATM